MRNVKLDSDMTLDILRRRKIFESPVTTKDNSHDGERMSKVMSESNFTSFWCFSWRREYH